MFYRTTAQKFEDAEILKLIDKTKNKWFVGGNRCEFRRTWWHLDFLFELVGVELRETETYSTHFKAHMHRPVTLESSIKFNGRAFIRF